MAERRNPPIINPISMKSPSQDRYSSELWINKFRIAGINPTKSSETDGRVLALLYSNPHLQLFRENRSLSMTEERITSTSQLINLTRLGYLPRLNNIDNHVWAELNLNNSTENHRNVVINNMAVYPIKVDIQLYIDMRKWDIRVFIKAGLAKGLYIDIYQFYHLEDFIFTFSTGVYPQKKGDIARANRLNRLPGEVLNIIYNNYGLSDNVNKGASISVLEQTDPFEKVVLSSIPLSTKMKQLGMVPSDLSTIDDAIYYENSIIYYNDVFKRPSNYVPPTLQQLSLMDVAHAKSELMKIKDSEILNIVGVKFPYNNRKELIDEVVRLFHNEEFFIVSEDNCKNRQTTTGTFLNNSVIQNNTIVGYGTLTNYNCYEESELQINFEHNVFNVPGRRGILFPADKVQKFLHWRVTHPIRAKVLSTNPNLRNENVKKFLRHIYKMGWIMRGWKGRASSSLRDNPLTDVQKMLGPEILKLNDIILNLPPNVTTEAYRLEEYFNGRYSDRNIKNMLEKLNRQPILIFSIIGEIFTSTAEHYLKLIFGIAAAPDLLATM